MYEIVKSLTDQAKCAAQIKKVAHLMIKFLFFHNKNYNNNIIFFLTIDNWTWIWILHHSYFDLQVSRQH